MKIELTETEINLIRDALHAFEPQNTGWEQIDLNELSDDLLEQTARRNDGWDEDERFNDAIPAAAQVVEDFIQMGIDAREAKKARAVQAFGDSDMRLGSMAAQRREALQRMMQGTATPVIVEDDDS